MLDLTLILLRDENENNMWIDYWAKSYPTIELIEISPNQSIAQWQKSIDMVAKKYHDTNLILVAHGIGANAAIAWYYQSSLQMQKQIVAQILVSPLKDFFINHPEYTFDKVRFNCKTALVIGQNDPLCPLSWATQQAEKWQAKLILAPQIGHINHCANWQWGMKLMQEMVLQ